MLYRILNVALVLFVAACVPITPEPPAPEFDVTRCSYGSLSLHPGQSAEDPIDNLPDYIDIVGVESGLEGEVLTATFHLRGIPNELTVNRGGVSPLRMEYFWHIQINVEVEEMHHQDTPEYMIGAFSDTSGQERSHTIGHELTTVSFGESFSTALWGLTPTSDENTSSLDPLSTPVKHSISHEDNTLTFVGEVPGITSGSLLTFQTHDYLYGHDSVSCYANISR